MPRFVGVAARHGADGRRGDPIEVDATFETMPSVLFDAVVVPDGAEAVDAPGGRRRRLEFVRDQYRHCKPMLALGASALLLERAGILPTLPSGEADPGIVLGRAGAGNAAARAFVQALAQHRHFERETDPPRV